MPALRGGPIGELNDRHTTSNGRPWTCTSVAAIKLLRHHIAPGHSVIRARNATFWCHATRYVCVRRCERTHERVQGSLRRSSVVAQDALWSNEDCYSAFVSHDPVVFVEVVVGAACCLEHFAQQQPKGFGVDAVR